MGKEGTNSAPNFHTKLSKKFWGFWAEGVDSRKREREREREKERERESERESEREKDREREREKRERERERDLVTRPKYPPLSRDRCSNTPVALCLNGVPQSKDRLDKGGIAEKTCL